MYVKSTNTVNRRAKAIILNRLLVAALRDTRHRRGGDPGDRMGRGGRPRPDRRDSRPRHLGPEHRHDLYREADRVRSRTGPLALRGLLADRGGRRRCGRVAGALRGRGLRHSSPQTARAGPVGIVIAQAKRPSRCITILANMSTALRRSTTVCDRTTIKASPGGEALARLPQTLFAGLSLRLSCRLLYFSPSFANCRLRILAGLFQIFPGVFYFLRSLFSDTLDLILVHGHPHSPITERIHIVPCALTCVMVQRVNHHAFVLHEHFLRPAPFLELLLRLFHSFFERLFPFLDQPVALLEYSLRLFFALLEDLPDLALLSPGLDEAEDQAARNRQACQGKYLAHRSPLMGFRVGLSHLSRRGPCHFLFLLILLLDGALRLPAQLDLEFLLALLVLQLDL